jgi:hypothetical protein
MNACKDIDDMHVRLEVLTHNLRLSRSNLLYRMPIQYLGNSVLLEIIR